MPFLRVLRDKRGYETTYLMHWFREANRQRSRILYVFRTPPGIKVGRDPMDPAIIGEIEAEHPDIEFDWRALRENQQVIDTSVEPRRSRKPRKEENERDKAPPDQPVPVLARSEAVQAASGSGGEVAKQPPLVIPSVIEGTSREDQFVFLLNTYLNLRDRVPHRTNDPIRREALVALVERLNPEAWVGEQAVVAGLQGAAEALERLSTLFARRRKRSRRLKGERGETPVPAETQGSETGGSDPPVRDTHVSDEDTHVSEASDIEPESDPPE